MWLKKETYGFLETKQPEPETKLCIYVFYGLWQN